MTEPEEVRIYNYRGPLTVLPISLSFAFFAGILSSLLTRGEWDGSDSFHWLVVSLACLGLGLHLVRVYRKAYVALYSDRLEFHNYKGKVTTVLNSEMLRLGRGVLAKSPHPPYYLVTLSESIRLDPTLTRFEDLLRHVRERVENNLLTRTSEVPPTTAQFGQ